MYSFPAAPFVKQGVTVLVSGYGLCPGVSITQVSDQARAALIWIWRNAGELGARARQADGDGLLGGLPYHRDGDGHGLDEVGRPPSRGPDKGGIPVSPPIELEPLRFASLNEALGMDAAKAKSKSPMNHPPVTDAPQLVVCGERDTHPYPTPQARLAGAATAVC